MNDIRKDFLIQRYSIISETRGNRPYHFDHKKSNEKKGQVCFFCPGNEKLTPPTVMQYPKSGQWEIRVFRNKFPALKPPKGDHEVLVETNKHGKNIEDLGVEHILEVFRMYEKRRIALAKKYKYVAIFKNVGHKAGASLPHSHSQILAGNFIPPIVSEERDASEKYYRKWHRCAWCDEIKKIDGKRIVINSKHAIAVTAEAPRYSYETWVMPKKHVGNFSELGIEGAQDFCSVLKEVLNKMKALGVPAYNYSVHDAQRGNKKSYHYHLEIIPRVANHAGYELGTGAYIIDVSPEVAAKMLRQA
jgi:UDPglucose--hexose-1-phosphate uridylyltransferase